MMVDITRGIRSLSKKRYTAKIASLFIIAILLFSSLYMIASIFSTPSNKQQPSGDQTHITLNLQQTKDYTYEGITYKFKYTQGTERNLLQVSANGQTPINYPAVSGTTYELSTSLYVTIDSVNEQTIGIHITPKGR